jgi:hypothetical protein
LKKVNSIRITQKGKDRINALLNSPKVNSYHKSLLTAIQGRMPKNVSNSDCEILEQIAVKYEVTPMRKITKGQAMYIAKKLGIRFSKQKYTYKDWLVGMGIELEHGKVNKKTDVTHDNLLLTGKIALAHLNEKWNYYRLLTKYVE